MRGERGKMNGERGKVNGERGKVKRGKDSTDFSSNTVLHPIGTNYIDVINAPHGSCTLYRALPFAGGYIPFRENNTPQGGCTLSTVF